MKRVMFSYIGLLCGIIVGMIFLQISGTFEKGYYMPPTQGYVVGFVYLFVWYWYLFVWLMYLLGAIIPFTIMGVILLIFIKKSKWQIPCSKIQNMEMGFFYAFLVTVGDYYMLLPIKNAPFYYHLPFTNTFFGDIIFPWFIFSSIVFLLVIVVDYYVLLKVPGCVIKK